MKKNLIIIGSGSSAKNCYHLIKTYDLFHVIGFAVDRIYKNGDTFLGKPLYAIEDLENIIDKENDLLHVALRWNRLNKDRRHIYELLKEKKYKFANIISPNAIIRGKTVGDNCFIHDRVVIDSEVIVGNNIFFDIGATVLHDSTIMDHAFIGAQTTICGGSSIGKQVFIGAGAVVFDDRKVGNKCIIGACTAVKRDIPDFTVIKTTQDNYVIKTYPEDVIEEKLMFQKNQH